jgi:hypothetical protein
MAALMYRVIRVDGQPSTLIMQCTMMPMPSM